MKVYGVVGWKNAGKTGLMERLVAEFTRRGIKVSTVKHAHHRVDVDQPGKDSFRHRQAGAGQAVLSSARRWALMTELRDRPEPPLSSHLARLDPCDLVLVEGFKRDNHPKVEAHRQETGNPLIATDDSSIRAVASDSMRELTPGRPVFDLDDTVGIADFILSDLGLSDQASVADQQDDPAPELKPPPLRDDCFALPGGVDWLPVDQAIAILKSRFYPLGIAETVPLEDALGRTLTGPVLAQASNPPAPNSAVDGYGFAHDGLPSGDAVLALVRGRAAAGAPYPGCVPSGQAIRVLTGAVLPKGVDTVILQEDVTLGDGKIAFRAGLRPGANTRKEGEDVVVGSEILSSGRRLSAGDLALCAASGVGTLSVVRRLRVAILSTGDELIEPGEPQGSGEVFDVNRVMLRALIQAAGHEPIDMGRVGDDRGALKLRLDQAVEQADLVLTSGGASAGDEDHVSALLNEKGAMALWRIAIKPGRPLALGIWGGKPVFGLPGNPVAAMVCTTVFALPVMGALSGRGWRMPDGLMLPAAFSKRKKTGRREYLRGRLRDGQVEVFPSEGSGRTSGLSWAEGLVELSDGATEVSQGDLVKFIPWSAFGILT